MMELPNDTIFHYWSEDRITIKVDAILLVRCKDCKYWQEDGYCEAWGDVFHHWEGYDAVPEDMYCGWGERRTDDTD